MLPISNLAASTLNTVMDFDDDNAPTNIATSTKITESNGMKALDPELGSVTIIQLTLVLTQQKKNLVSSKHHQTDKARLAFSVCLVLSLPVFQKSFPVLQLRASPVGPPRKS